jgi:RNA polymerase sigma factor (sigma-70 family)
MPVPYRTHIYGFTKKEQDPASAVDATMVCCLIMRYQRIVRWAAVTEEEIIKHIGTGGKAMDAGVKALYQTAAQPMLRFFVCKGLSGDDAKDVLQDTIVKIVRSVNSFKGDGAAKAWLWQVARNCLIDHQRKQGSLANHEVAVNDERWQTLEDTTPDENAQTCVMTGSVDECVTIGVDKLNQTEPERAYVLMLHMDGLSNVEPWPRPKNTYPNVERKSARSLLIALTRWRIERSYDTRLQ